MRKAEKLVKELEAVSEQYQELIDKRKAVVDMADNVTVHNTDIDKCIREFGGSTLFTKNENEAFVMEERRLYNQSRNILHRLAHADPENFFFSKHKKLTASKKFDHISKKGDNGYHLCLKCGKYFEFSKVGLDGNGRFTNWGNKQSFNNCSEHEGKKDAGFVYILKDLPSQQLF